jgi:hypothetical protein
MKQFDQDYNEIRKEAKMKSFKEYLVEAKEKEVQIKFSGPATEDVVDDFLSSAKEKGLDIELEKADEGVSLSTL